MNTHKMYVLVRLDLAETYRCVQGTHAVVAFALEHQEELRTWNNHIIAFVGVRNLRELMEYKQLLQELGKKFSSFSEPDQLGAETAIACYDQGEIFSKLPTA